MSTTPRVFAIVPAAGQSRRMGKTKQLLDIAGRPMLLAVLEPLAAAEVRGIAVAVSPLVEAQLPQFPPKAFAIVNADPDSEMIDSIRLALDAWRDRAPPAATDGYLVCPADQPGIPTTDFNACINAFRANPDHIVIASRAQKRGHPIIFPAPLADFVHSREADTGLNTLPHRYPDKLQLIECPTPAITRDIDTPNDYEANI